MNSQLYFVHQAKLRLEYNLDVSDTPPISKVILDRPSNHILENEANETFKKKKKGLALNLNMLTKGTKRTYAQGTKLMAVAGGIRPVPLKMTGLRSSVSIQFGDDLSKYFGEKTLDRKCVV